MKQKIAWRNGWASGGAAGHTAVGDPFGPAAATGFRKATAASGCSGKLARLAGLLCLVFFPATAVHAQQCDPRMPQINFVQDNLHRVTIEGDLATAQDFADRARRQLDQLAGSARRCGCPPAQAKFEELVLELRRAQRLDNRKELRELAARAKLGFKDGVESLKTCAERH